MKRAQRHLLKSASFILTGTLFVAGLSAIKIPAQAATDPDGARLVQERRCNACHSMTKYLIGPPFSAIALRHAQHKDIMVDVLAEKIILGGPGNWGVVPMVPNPHVSWDEARVIAKWILELDTK
jgi:cytochrome c